MIEFAPADNELRRGYRTLSTSTLTGYLAGCSEVAARLGGRSTDWSAEERGDGNLNLIFLVRGPGGAVIVKQALPYVRMVGPSWPLALSRAHFEQAALHEQARWTPTRVPAVLRVDAELSLMVMEYLAPHAVVRKALLAGRHLPLLGPHLGQFLARSAFYSSDLFLSAAGKRTRIRDFLGNSAMCRISEDLIFDEPYSGAAHNRHTSPQLDEAVQRLQQDAALTLAAQQMKWLFLNQLECLMHGDLHTGSIMATDTDTRVIDPEFACYGPMGFDLGMLLGNLMLAYCAQPGQEREPGERAPLRRHLLDTVATLWAAYRTELARLQAARTVSSPGDAYPSRVLASDPDSARRVLDQLLARTWTQAVGFAGCEMIRLLVGLAHVEDFESIAAATVRAKCERAALDLGTRLLLEREIFNSVGDVIAAAENL